jgi:hypothetical protein
MKKLKTKNDMNDFDHCRKMLKHHCIRMSEDALFPFHSEVGLALLRAHETRSICG